MSTSSRSLLPLLFFAALAPVVPSAIAEPAKQAQPADAADAAIARLKNYRFGNPLGDVHVAERLVNAASSEQRAVLATKLAAVLDDAAATADAKGATLLILGLTNLPAVVPVIEKRVSDAALANDAVNALSLIHGEASEAALVRLLSGNLPEATRIGCLNALALRGTPGALAAIAAAGKSASPALAAAAYEELAKAGTPAALTAILALPENGGVRARAVLSVADNILRKGGDKSAIVAPVSAVFASTKDPESRIEAARLLLKSDVESAKLGNVLADAATSAGAARQFVLSGRPDALAAVVAAYPSFNDATKASVLAAARDAGAAPLAEIVRKEIASPSPELRALAAYALPRCGAEDAASRLIALLGDTPPVAHAARQALGLMPDGAKLRAAASGTDAPAVRAAALGILAGSRDRETFALALDLAKQSDATIRAAAFDAIASLATPRDLPAVLGAAKSVVKSADRRAWKKALIATATGHPNHAEAVKLLRAAVDASGAGEKSEIIAAITLVPGDEAGVALRQMLSGPSIESRKEIIRALASARNNNARTLLLETAGKATDPGERTLALRGYLDTIAALPLKPAERLADYRSAWPLAGTEEKASIVAAVKEIKSDDAKKFLKEIEPAQPEKPAAKGA